MEKLLEMAANGAGHFYPTNQDLADILSRTDLHYDNFYFSDFLIPDLMFLIMETCSVT